MKGQKKRDKSKRRDLKREISLSFSEHCRKSQNHNQQFIHQYSRNIILSKRNYLIFTPYKAKSDHQLLTSLMFLEKVQRRQNDVIPT